MAKDQLVLWIYEENKIPGCSKQDYSYFMLLGVLNVF